MSCEIIYSEKMDEQYSNIMLEGLYKQANSKKGLSVIEQFAFTMVDENKNFIAGIKGVTLYGAMHINLLFVSEGARGKGYGSIMMEKAENLAQQKKCNFVYLNTMDWEAKPFYEKLGYVVEYVQQGYDKNSSMYMLRKQL